VVGFSQWPKKQGVACWMKEWPMLPPSHST
jgi:hypothetical protein